MKTESFIELEVSVESGWICVGVLIAIKISSKHKSGELSSSALETILEVGYQIHIVVVWGVYGKASINVIIHLVSDCG